MLKGCYPEVAMCVGSVWRYCMSCSDLLGHVLMAMMCFV